jgi:hypothetical protein
MNEVDAGCNRATPEEERVIQSKHTCDAKEKTVEMKISREAA